MQIDIIRYIQQIANPFWDFLFTGVSILGEEVFLISLLGWVYWCFDKRLGYKIGFLYVINAPLNFILKWIFNAPRPIGQDGIRTIYADTATGSSFPSGHSQLGGGLFYFFFKNSTNRVWKIVFIIIALFIPLSRLYLGVHFPIDVVAGFVVGIGVVYLADYVFEALYEKHTEYFLLFALPALVYAFIDGGEDIYKVAGLVTSFVIGMIVEKRFINFPVEARLTYQIIKYVLGICAVMAIRVGLKRVLPDALWAGFVRYFALGVYVTIIHPWAIKRFTKNLHKII
ncbi:MAG: phosphatase PAP2 family protein [Eubacteriales bacterium]|nr:phosphatase PAP2 family protein [Eubacteriales bacterium]